MQSHELCHPRDGEDISLRSRAMLPKSSKVFRMSSSCFQFRNCIIKSCIIRNCSIKSNGASFFQSRINRGLKGRKRQRSFNKERKAILRKVHLKYIAVIRRRKLQFDVFECLSTSKKWVFRRRTKEKKWGILVFMCST